MKAWGCARAVAAFAATGILRGMTVGVPAGVQVDAADRETGVSRAVETRADGRCVVTG